MLEGGRGGKYNDGKNKKDVPRRQYISEGGWVACTVVIIRWMRRSKMYWRGTLLDLPYSSR